MGTVYEVSMVVTYSKESPGTDTRYFINARDTTLPGEDAPRERLDTFIGAVLDRYTDPEDVITNRSVEDVRRKGDVVVHSGPVDRGIMRRIGIGLLGKISK